jgi:hypothetical protein
LAFATSVVAVSLSQPFSPLQAESSHTGQTPGGSVGAPIILAASRGKYLETPPGKKPRVVITADPELDDLNSLIRFVLHSADYKTEGLIYASSMYHWKGDGTGKTQNLPSRQYNRNGRDWCPCGGRLRTGLPEPDRPQRRLSHTHRAALESEVGQRRFRR